ncbi:MAG: hypothetical protein WCA24_06475, partial [Thiomonas sp.]
GGKWQGGASSGAACRGLIVLCQELQHLVVKMGAPHQSLKAVTGIGKLMKLDGFAKAALACRAIHGGHPAARTLQTRLSLLTVDVLVPPECGSAARVIGTDEYATGHSKKPVELQRRHASRRCGKALRIVGQFIWKRVPTRRTQRVACNGFRMHHHKAVDKLTTSGMSKEMNLRVLQSIGTQPLAQRIEQGEIGAEPAAWPAKPLIIRKRIPREQRSA